MQFQNLTQSYERARLYDATQGRFIGRDPLGYVDDLNRYASFLSLMQVDPTGTKAYTCRCNCTIASSGGVYGGLSHYCNVFTVDADDYSGAREKCKVQCKAEEKPIFGACISCRSRLIGLGNEDRSGLLCDYLASLCDEYPEPQRSECRQHAKKWCECIGAAYDAIMDQGGPVWFDKNGPVCTECVEAIYAKCKNLGLGQRIKYFYLDGRAAWGGPNRPLDYTGLIGLGTHGHQWQILIFRGVNGKRAVATIDVWSDPVDWWNEGKDSCGHTHNYPSR